MLLLLFIALVLCGYSTKGYAVPYKPGTLAATMQPFIDSHRISGAVMLVADKQKVLALEAVGYADMAAKRPMKADTMFAIASMTKAMTATAIMMLVDEGKLSLNDPVEKYLPEFKDQMVLAEADAEHRLLHKPKAPITILQCLNHTSGLSTNYPFTSLVDTPSMRERVLAAALIPLQFEPDSQFAYGNGGYETAGRIIEVVSGMSYGEFMEKRLFKPLGMSQTRFVPTKGQVERLAKLYTPNEQFTKLTETPLPVSYPLTDPSRVPFAAGGLFSDAKDVAKYCQMVLNGGAYKGMRYLSEQATGKMTTTTTGRLLNDGVAENGYGLGWNTGQYFDSSAPLSTKPFAHSGAFRTDMYIDPANELIFIFMVQVGNMTDSSPFTLPFHQAALECFGKAKR